MSLRSASASACLVALLACVACSSSTDNPATTNNGAGGTDSGTSQGACDAQKLVAVWSGTNYTMQIKSDMSYQAAGRPNLNQIDVNGTVQVSGCNITLVDVSGVYACPSDQLGKYTFAVTDTTLTFTLVDDPCEGRKLPLGRGPLTKQ